MRRALVPLVLVLAGCGHGPTRPDAEPAAAPATTAAPSARAEARVVRVPAALGVPVSEAVGQLREAGLRARVVEVDSPLADGKVLRQTPQPGASARLGSAVVLSVARQITDARPNQVVIPGVVGMTVAAAAARLESAELRVAVVRGTSVVRRETPPAGTHLRRGSLVTLR